MSGHRDHAPQLLQQHLSRAAALQALPNLRLHLGPGREGDPGSARLHVPLDFVPKSAEVRLADEPGHRDLQPNDHPASGHLDL